MSELRFEPVGAAGDDAVLRDWQDIHNLVIPTDPLSVDDIRERAGRNRLEVAYVDRTAVGCSTVRPPVDGTATVIARVRPSHRRGGLGERIYRRAIGLARDLGAEVIETVVLASNDDGLRFALRHGFVEFDRYVLAGHTVAYIDLRLE